MDLAALINNKAIKSKEKTEAISHSLLNGELLIDDLLNFAKLAKETIKATCIESIEFATKANPNMANENCMIFVLQALSEKAPRIKWESAKVIGNISFLYPQYLTPAIENLLLNTNHDGTVVRWSAAYAISEIYKLKSAHNKKLLPIINKMIEIEPKESIKKIYKKALQ